MKTGLLALASALGSAAHAAVIIPDPGIQWKAVADRVFSTVVEVRGERGTETVSSGTGVLVGNGLAITTLHAVTLSSPDGKLTALRDVRVLVPDLGPLDARVMAGAPDLDLALLRLSDQGASLEGASLATRPPSDGDLLVAMGTEDEAVTALGVVVAGVSGDLFGLASKRTIDSRFWGGPLFDAQGRLVGIQLTSASGSKAISARVIQRMIEQRSVTPDLAVPP